MKARGIQFDPESIRGLRAGVKIRTRRIVSGHPLGNLLTVYSPVDGRDFTAIYAPPGPDTPPTKRVRLRCPYGPLGSVFWVKERCTLEALARDRVRITYAVDGATAEAPVDVVPVAQRWEPKFYFMPRYTARTFLRITEIRLESLQSIPPTDAVEEGWITREAREETDPVGWYRWRWNLLNAASATRKRRRDLSWEINPWVWALKLQLLESEELCRN